MKGECQIDVEVKEHDGQLYFSWVSNNHMNLYPRRRPHRMSPSLYQESGRVFSVTVGTSPRRPIFEDLPFSLACIEHLKLLRDVHQVSIYAYCLMPDHVHLLVESTPQLSLPQVVQQWKSLCYRERRKAGKPEKFWQRGYFDRALRKEEDLRSTARYIVNNPVRAGMVVDFRDYPLCGSLVWELE